MVFDGKRPMNCIFCPIFVFVSSFYPVFCDVGEGKNIGQGGSGKRYRAIGYLFLLFFIVIKRYLMPYANLQIAFTEADYLLVRQDIINLRNKFPFAVNLTPKDKTQHLHLGKKTLPFVQKALQCYTETPELQTGFLSVAEWQNDWETMQRLEKLLLQLNSLQEMVEDTVVALRMENTTAALTFYKLLKNAAEQNVPGTTAILAELKTMLPGSFQKKKTPPANEPEQ